MGKIQKIGDVYYIEFYARGLLYSQIAGPDLHAAEKLLEETEKKIAGGEALTIVRHIDVPVFFQQYLEHVTQDLGVRSARRYEDLINHFTQFLAKQHPNVTQLAQVTPSVMESYKASRKPTTKAHLINFSILLLRDMMDYGIKIGFLNDNPTVHMRLLPWPKRTLMDTKRATLAKDLFKKGIGIGKTSKLLGLTDVAQAMYYANFIPLNREEMYN